ncbi:MAG: hypothetical protein KatS3mg105_4804 [Gemmatales bacterium]|nr:MAG: hypothetical protein KatS3mg105_4804 [Gemmatales bacterium]
MVNASESPYIVMIPVFNDWTALARLLRSLEQELAQKQLHVQVLLVDDGSTESLPADFLWSPADTESATTSGDGSSPAVKTSLRAFTKVEVLELRRNLGHQRAIAIGLAYLHANEQGKAVIIMDGDGEDDPRDVPRLIQRFEELGGRSVVFARRAQRSESYVFRIFYQIYRFLHRTLTGHGINVGNFSIVPFTAIDRLVAVTELWNHFASAVFKAKIAYSSIPTKRACRLAGRTRMNFVELISHGLSAISAHSDIVGVRMLLASLVVIFLAIIGLVAVVVVRLTTDLVVPGLATNAFGLLLVMLFQALMSSVLFFYIILNNRHGPNFLPIRDYCYFVLRTRRIDSA